MRPLGFWPWVWPRMWPWVCFWKIPRAFNLPLAEDYSRDRPRAQIHLATPSAFPQIIPILQTIVLYLSLGSTAPLLRLKAGALQVTDPSHVSRAAVGMEGRPGKDRSASGPPASGIPGPRPPTSGPRPPTSGPRPPSSGLRPPSAPGIRPPSRSVFLIQNGILQVLHLPPRLPGVRPAGPLPTLAEHPAPSLPRPATSIPRFSTSTPSLQARCTSRLLLTSPLTPPPPGAPPCPPRWLRAPWPSLPQLRRQPASCLLTHSRQPPGRPAKQHLTPRRPALRQGAPWQPARRRQAPPRTSCEAR